MTQPFADFDVPFAISDLVQALAFVDSTSQTKKPLPALVCLSDPAPAYEMITLEPYSLELGHVKRL
jgi:hypothetical protein